MGRRADEKRERVERMVRFPAPLYVRLRDKAEREQRSIQGQVIHELDKAIPKGEA